MTIANWGLFYNNRNFNPQYVSLELKNLFMVLTLVQEQIHLSEEKKKNKRKKIFLVFGNNYSHNLILDLLDIKMKTIIVMHVSLLIK